MLDFTGWQSVRDGYTSLRLGLERGEVARIRSSESIKTSVIAFRASL